MSTYSIPIDPTVGYRPEGRSKETNDQDENLPEQDVDAKQDPLPETDRNLTHLSSLTFHLRGIQEAEEGDEYPESKEAIVDIYEGQIRKLRQELQTQKAEVTRLESIAVAADESKTGLRRMAGCVLGGTFCLFSYLMAYTGTAHLMHPLVSLLGFLIASLLFAETAFTKDVG